MTSQIEEKIRKCKICCQYQRARAEPLLPSSLPELPWQKVGTVLFVWKRSTYLLVIDYYSRFIEVAELSSVKSESVILKLKKIFARHGIPQLVISDNGLNMYHFQLLILQNRMASNIVPVVLDTHKPMEKQRGQCRVVKQLWRKEDDPYLALMSYLSTTIKVGYSSGKLFDVKKHQIITSCFERRVKT